MIPQEIDMFKLGLQMAVNVPAAYIILGIVAVAVCSLIGLNLRLRARKRGQRKRDDEGYKGE